MTMIKLFKNRKYLVCLFLLSGFLILSFFSYHQNSQKTVSVETTNLPALTENQLKGYNGQNPGKPIYIGLDGYVYDVTAGKKFYQPGGAYHNLAGKDSTSELKVFGGDIIKRKYPVVAILKK